MKKKRFVIICLLSTSLLITVYLKLSSPEIVKRAYEGLVLKQSHDKDFTTIDSKNAPLESPPKLIKTVHQQDEWVVEGVRRQMTDISNAYAENIRYPKYSKPLHANDWNLLNPRAFIPKAIPLAFDEGISAAIVLSQYIVSREDNLEVSVQLSGESLTRVRPESVLVYLSGQDQVNDAFELRSYVSHKGVLTYSGVLDKSKFDDLDDSETMIVAEIHFENEVQANVSAAFKLVGTDALLTRLGSSYVEDAHLIVPAHFDVATAGYYRVEANLFDAASQTPISHLNSAFVLSKRENSGLLKIHASTLRSKGLVGPYILRDFNITRGPSRPGDKTGYGKSEKPSFTVQGFDFSLYSQESYEDPKNQQRLEFLQKMAGID